MDKLSLVSLNINGLKNDKKRKALFTLLRSNNYDIIFLQETHCHLKQEQKRWSLEWDGQSIWCLGCYKSKGVTVLFNRNVSFDFENVEIDINGRYIIFDLVMSDSKYRLMNIYAPNNPKERQMFFNKLQDYELIEHEMLISGDFNCTLNPEIDRLNCVNSCDIGSVEVTSIINKFDLEDVFRRRFPDKKTFSWNRSKKGSRIDYWLISRSLDNQVESIDYKVCPLSDHNLVQLKFRVTEMKHGPGIWKMNKKTITSSLFQKSFVGLWRHWQTQKQLYNDLTIWWDLGKKKIKDLAVNVSNELHRQKNVEIKKLEEFINRSYQDQQTLDKGKEDLERAERNLRELLEQKGEGARIRSRINWHEKGETSSNYFHSLEKRNAKDKMWECVLDENSQPKYGINDILETQVKFYSDLYKSELIESEKKSIFLNAMETKLNQDDKNYLDENISLEELSKSLKRMKNNKAPGPDGILTEFYKIYWQEVGNDLTEVLQFSFENEKLPQSQYLALIRLLFKKGQREHLKNWRPISLLNTDFKILSKLLAERLKKVLPSIIHKDQKGCVQGRFIGENISLIRDIVDSCNGEEVILLIDQQKAFDRVEFDWLFEVLRKFNFGMHFIKWLRVIYKEMKSCILTNGYVSKTFRVTRGIRQGDSLSALLYILQCEPLSSLLRNTNEIKGITLKGYENLYEVRNKHYVDDTFICLENVEQIDKCLNIFDDFGKASGAKINRDKTVGLAMNERVVFEKSTSNNVKLTLGPVKVLGVPAGKVKQMDFWEAIIQKINKQLAIWKRRNLSLQGKVYVIRSLCISKILFSTEYFNINDHIVNKLEKILYEYLWDGKKNKVRKDVCVLPRKMGGLGMVDLRLALKVQKIKWIRRILCSDENDEWAFHPIKCLKCLDKKFDVNFFTIRAYDTDKCLKNINVNEFYISCVKTFQELCRKGRIKSNKDIIWCNTALKFNGDTLDWAHWAKSGLLYRHDIIKDFKINEQYIYEKLIYKANCYFDIAKLKASIPKDWLDASDVSDNNNISTDEQSCRKDILNTKFEIPGGSEKIFFDLTSKDIYNVLLLNKKTVIKSKDYWRNKFKNVQINFDLWYMCLLNCEITPRKCIDFNWRILHGQVNTETRLAKMKFSNGICRLCNIDLENLDHLLFDCEHVKQLWDLINQKFGNTCGFVCDRFTVIIGILEETVDAKVCNMILSITRWLIWKRRNKFKFDDKFDDIDKLFVIVNLEIMKHIDILMRCNKIKKNKDIFKILENIVKN